MTKSKQELIEKAVSGDTTPTPTVAKTVSGYKHVSRVAYGQEDVTHETVQVADFGNEPVGHVTVGAHITKNLGNYESAKVNVEVSLPVLASHDEVVRVYGEITELVNEMIAEQLAGLKQ